MSDDGYYLVQVFGGDVGGLDLDFEAATLEEARTIARKEHREGCRPTLILDNNHHVLEDYS